MPIWIGFTPVLIKGVIEPNDPDWEAKTLADIQEQTEKQIGDQPQA